MVGFEHMGSTEETAIREEVHKNGILRGHRGAEGCHRWCNSGPLRLCSGPEDEVI